MKWTYFMLVMLAGCVASIPYDDAGITAELASETAKMVMAQRSEGDKKPDTGDRCSNCGGAGKVGDGRVFVTCPVCKGTGRKTKSCPGGTCEVSP